MRINENNKVFVAGEIISDFEFSHEFYGEKFYLFDLKTDRNSGHSDILPILVSDRIVNVKESAKGATVEIEGQMRSYNKHTEEKSYVVLTIFACRIENTDALYFDDQVELHGFICKEPIYRKTPLGRDITDFILAVNRPYGNVDYIPCIAWGRDALYLGASEIGKELKLEGRFQSREYKKKIGENEYETRTAFEVSVRKLEVVENECED